MASTNAQERTELINSVLADDKHGKKIYLLGSAEFGPTNEPILIKTSVGLHNKFGKQGTLIDAFHQIKYTNKNNQVYLVKTTGEHAIAYMNVNVEGGEIIEDGIVFSSSQSNEIYNEIEIVNDVDGIKFIFPKELGLKDKQYLFSNYKTIDGFVKAINKDTKNKNSCIYAHYTVDSDTPIQNALFACNPNVVYMYGGQCGLGYNKNLLYNCLAKTYNILESHDIDIIVPVDAFIDDIYPDDSEDNAYQYDMKYYQSTKDYLSEDFSGHKLSFMNQLLQFCLKQLNFGLVTTGIMGYNSSYKHWSLYLSESDDIATMYKHCLEYNLACCENSFYSFLISVVAGDIRYNRGTIIDNGYLAYAALCASTSITSGTTNIPISDTISLHHEFSEEVLKDLATNGIVTFRHSPLYDTPVIYDGITTCTCDENFSLYCNVRMIQMCISYINRLFQYYIGQDIASLIEYNIIQDDLKLMLSKIQSMNVINDYDFVIVPFYAKGEVNVYLNLRTNYMVKSVQLCSVINVDFIEEEE